MLPKFWNEQEFSSAQCIVGLNNWLNAAVGLLSPVLLIMFSVSVSISARLDSSSHSCWTASCSLFKMENSWEAATEICLSATYHIKWSDLLSFLTENVHNRVDKCELNTFYLILLNACLILELTNPSHSQKSMTNSVHSILLEVHIFLRFLRGSTSFPLHLR